MSLTVLFLILIAMGLLFIGLAIPMILGKVKPNKLYGFRTKKTLSDEKIWYPANKFSGKVMVAAGSVIIILTAIILTLHMTIEFLNGFTELGAIILWIVILFIPLIVMIVVSLLYLRKL